GVRIRTPALSLGGRGPTPVRPRTRGTAIGRGSPPPIRATVSCSLPFAPNSCFEAAARSTPDHSTLLELASQVQPSRGGRMPLRGANHLATATVTGLVAGPPRARRNS